MAPKRPATFRIDEAILAALQHVKERDGISVSDQVEKALTTWLDAMGVSPLAGKDRTMRLLERHAGTGLVSRDGGQEIGLRRYNLSVWQDVHVVETLRGTSEIEGMKEVKGAIRFDGLEMVGLVGENLTLRLEDGRHFKFFLVNSHGEIAPRGGIE